jgi:diguanylate cyclase (GGDEF)-like protein
MIDDGRQGDGPIGSGDGSGTGTGEPRPDAARLAADSAQLLEANRHLREAVQRRDEFLSLAAEELRGPAASLLRHVKRLRGSAPAALGEAEIGVQELARDHRALDALDRQAHRVAAVSEGLLAIRDIEGGQIRLQRRPTELGAFLTRLAEARLASAQARAVELAHEIPPYPLTVSVDPERLWDAVGALVDSALARTSSGDRVRLALETLPDGARITVEDGRMTYPQARRAPDRLAGLGIGLAVSRGVAELHGGGLEIATRGTGRTAILTVRSTAPAEEREPPRRTAGEGRPRVLVVDDDPDALEALAMILGDDYEVLLAADGREAVETTLMSRPDLVLMDLYMPRMDGLAALEAIRGDPLTEDVPIILISGRGDDLTRSRSLDLGAVDFLQKPFSSRELKARIDRTLRLTRRETLLQELARTDALTGLANLRAFRARLEDEVKRARRYRTPLACVMVDMDRLKPINDELGHGAGDLAIEAVADVIRNELRETDFAARYGGDEFVMLLPHTSAAEARVFAERVCARLLEASIDVGDRRLQLSGSFGIAALGDDPLGDPAEALVRHADAALYTAKRAGRGRVAAHSSAEGDPRLPAQQ